jgi:hypothetical protein
MFRGPVIIWAASRAPSPTEGKICSHVARAVDGQVRAIAIETLGNEIVSSLLHGPVVVVVDSRKDAATALKLGADETVRVAQSVTLRKATLEDAVDRATMRSGARTRPPLATASVGEYPTFALLMRVVERQLGGTLNQAAIKCSELADELTRTIAVADGLMQRVRHGSAREELREWAKDVRDYAQATLRTEALVSELREQVEQGDAVIRLMGNLSSDGSAATTDAESLILELADLLVVDLGEQVSLEVVTAGPCPMRIPRSALLYVICGAVESALDNIRSGEGRGHIKLAASKLDTEVLIEVADDGIAGSADLRASIVDSLLADPRVARMRQLRDCVRGLGGELSVDMDDTGTLVSIYLPITPEEVPTDEVTPLPRTRHERRH